jgi:hypothetical protein
MADEDSMEFGVPGIEVLAAFRMSYRTAEREGFPRTAQQVLNYVRELEAMDRAMPHGVWKIVVTKREVRNEEGDCSGAGGDDGSAGLGT